MKSLKPRSSRMLGELVLTLGLCFSRPALASAEEAVERAVDPAVPSASPEPAAENAEAPLANPFRIAPPRKEGDAFVPSDNPAEAIPDVQERSKDQLGFGYFVMELTDKATAALDRKDYPEAVKYFDALARAVPDRAVAWSKLCEAYGLMGDTKSAQLACDYAMVRPGTVVLDHTRFVDLYLTNHPGTLKPEEIARLDKIIAHVQARPEAAVLGAQAACRLGVRLEDAERLTACTKVLNAQLPHDPVTISYSWALAVAEHDRDAAERELQRAEAAGLPAAALTTMRERGMKLVDRGHSNKVRWTILSVCLVAALAAAGVFVSRRKKNVAHV